MNEAVLSGRGRSSSELVDVATLPVVVSYRVTVVVTFSTAGAAALYSTPFQVVALRVFSFRIHLSVALLPVRSSTGMQEAGTRRDGRTKSGIAIDLYMISNVLE